MDPMNLQRLVDGECSVEEIQQLLSGAMDSQESWRNVATAFIEDQLFRRQFNDQDQPSPPELASQPDRAIEPLPLGKRNSSRGTTLLHWVAIAAAVCLAALIGYIVGNDPGDPVGQVPIASAPEPAADEIIPEQESTFDLAANRSEPRMTNASLPDYRMQLLDEDGEHTDSALYNRDIPLYSVNSRDQLDRLTAVNRQQMELPDEWKAKLADRGIRTRVRVDYVSGNLKDGRSFVIPVRTINFYQGQ